MISLVTPTNGSKYLEELWKSIQAQTYTNWEWLLVPNNGASIPEEIASHPKVKVLPFESSSIGALKKFGFTSASGEILVEVDHDDLLTPNCLERLLEGFKDPEVGFVYSYSAHLGKGGKFASNYGWEYKTHSFNGEELIVPCSFEPSPNSLCYGWYAPNHIRAWRKSAYLSTGGHNEALELGDDFDLLCRTYLVTKMKLLPEVLYIYRIHGENTWLQKNTKLQQVIRKLYRVYSLPLVERWCELNNLLKIDLGGAFNCPKGYLSLDLEEPCSIQCNLEKGIPLPSNSVGIVRAVDILEHVSNKQKLISEIHRVLADSGWLFARVPSTDGRGAFQDPTHVSYWNQNSFWYWTRPETARYIRNKDVAFQEFLLTTEFPSEWHKAANIPYVIAELSAVKSDSRRPHFLPVWEPNLIPQAA